MGMDKTVDPIQDLFSRLMIY